jgi:PII-like signaling protein
MVQVSIGVERRMKLGYDGLRLRIFVHESVRYDHQPLYEYLVKQARREGIAGATVFRGVEGFGLHRHVHTTRLIEDSDDLPVILEFVDRPEAIRRFLAELGGVIEHGAATVSPVEIVRYGRSDR